MVNKKINKCENGHYFTSTECKFCKGKIVEQIDAQEGDCIICGQLCPEYAYCCSLPKEEKSNNSFIKE